MNPSILRTAGLCLLLGMLLGCTAEKPQKKVLKEDIISKDIIEAVATHNPSSLESQAQRVATTGSKYMFLASVSTSDRKGDATPFYQGSENMVKFEWTKNSLRVLNIERDARFADKNVNFKPVLEIPVEHVDYKCSEDAYGDCTSREEENNEIESLQRGFFRPKISDAQVQMLTGAPLLGPSSASGGGCAAETSSRLVGYEFSKDAINIEIERSFITKLSWRCITSIISTWEGLSDLTFTTRHFFSIVKLDDLRTKNYRPIVYSETEKDTFGFFTSREITLDLDHTDTVDSKKMYLNRWAPNRTVEFYLNETFNQPEHRKIKQVTYESFDAINESLKAAGAQLRLKLNDPVKDMSPGDLRYNMVVMIDDPLKTGPIGYGPSNKNPETGEILKANTMMYLGTMKKYVRIDYDRLIKEKRAEAQQLSRKAALTLSPQLKAQIFKPWTENVKEEATQQVSDNQETPRNVAGIEPIPTSFAQNAREFAEVQKHKHSPEVLASLIGFVKNPLNYTDESSELEADIENMSRNNVYPAELFNFNAAIVDGVNNLSDKFGLRLWAELNKEEQAEVLNTLLPFVWRPTFIHEIGHNLGLRHNFGGSTDSENFYTPEELKAMGVKSEWRYSTVMDYAYRPTNELQVMGKYDIAALRYAYTEQVEKADGSMISLSDYQRAIADGEADSLNLRPYVFCTDEHTVSPTCNRFDEGTNLTEIAQHMINTYNYNYDTSNKRYNRRSFSLYTDTGAARRVTHYFWNLRQMYERYELYRYKLGVSDDSTLWETNTFLKDARQAAMLGVNHLISVIKTPDTLCALANAANPNMVVALRPLTEIDPYAISCFEDRAIESAARLQQVVVGEAGKSLNSRRQLGNPNSSAAEIDIRGIWIDKLLAARYLFQREFNSIISDDYTENYLVMGDARPLILDMVDQVINDSYVAPLEFTDQEGVKFNFGGDIAYKDFAQSEIQEPLDWTVGYLLNLPSEPTNFRRELLQTMARELPSRLHGVKSAKVLSSIEASTTVKDMGRLNEYTSVNYNGRTFYALPENTYALDAMAKYNASLANFEILRAVPRERLITLYNLKVGGQPTGVLTPEETAVFDLGMPMVYDFLTFALTEPEAYITLLAEMSETTDKSSIIDYSTSFFLEAQTRELSISEVDRLLSNR